MSMKPKYNKMSWKKSESPRERHCKRLADIIKDTDEFFIQIPSQRCIKFSDTETWNHGYSRKQDGTPINQRRDYDFSSKAWLID